MQSHPLLSPQDFWSRYLQSRVAHIRNTCYLDKSHHGYARGRQMIDDELGEMYVTMRALRTERNTLAPVCRLPPEILSRIFLMCADNSLPQMGRRSWRRPLGWLQVTHVCKRWRKTALHYPYIWTKISSGLSRPWLQKTIARAKLLPLSITFDSIAMMTHQREISKHISRIRDFFLHAEHADFLMPTLQEILAFPINVLQHLCITHDSWTDLALPENTLQYYARALHSVDLRSVYIPWSSPILYNLTHLRANLRDDLGGHAEELNRDEIESDKLPSCHLLSGLRGMPALQSLDLTFCLPSEGDGSVVDLPKLKSLTLKDEPARCMYFITCLGIPSSCSLTLVCDTYSEKELTDGVIPIFHTHVKREQGPIQSLALKAYKSCFVFHISRAANGAEKTGPPEPSYTLQLSHPTYASGALALPWPTVAALCRELPIESVRHLDLRHQEGCDPDSHMEHATHWSPGAWVNILGRCGVAHEVRFYGDRPAMLAFCLALTLRARREGAPFLENLCSLTLRGLRLTAADQGEGSEFLKAFLEQLAARQRAKTIQTVCIKWKKAGEQFIVELGNIVPEVKWNELKDTVGESDISDKDEEDEEDWSDDEDKEDGNEEEDKEDGSEEENKEDQEDASDEEDQDNEDSEDESD